MQLTVLQYIFAWNIQYVFVKIQLLAHFFYFEILKNLNFHQKVLYHYLEMEVA